MPDGDVLGAYVANGFFRLLGSERHCLRWHYNPLGENYDWSTDWCFG